MRKWAKTCASGQKWAKVSQNTILAITLLIVELFEKFFQFWKEELKGHPKKLFLKFFKSIISPP
jgi:hypothetical protein